MTQVTVETERIDDMPLLITLQQEMGIGDVLDEVVVRHGNRQGLSMGQMTVGWLTFILSQSDHRLSYVEDWAEKQAHTLSYLMGQPVNGQDFTDDRLGDGLCLLSDDAVWASIEEKLGVRLIQVYDLTCKVARIDTTSVVLYHDSDKSELYAHGHSKDHRSDLAQIKAALLTLDPLALPTVTLVMAGNQADDTIYLPVIANAHKVLQQPGMLYVGDSKMEALTTRATLVQAGDYYLLPLSQKSRQSQQLPQLVQRILESETIELTSVYSLPAVAGGEVRLLAQGWETEERQEATVNGETIQWSERLLLIYSPALAQSGYRGLEQRLKQAEIKLTALTPKPGKGKKVVADQAQLQAEVQAILTQYRVADYLEVACRQEVKERHIRRYRERPARTETTIRYYLTTTRNEPAIQSAYRAMGWRLYVTNAPSEQLSLADAVRTYRGSVPTIERDFARLKGRPLGLRPVFVQRDDHLTGLVRLLSLALRVLTVAEFVVRRSLQEAQESLAGLYPGNPTKATNRPTTERLLKSFDGLTLSIIDLPGETIRYVTPLSLLQSRILQLLKFSDSIYTGLALPEPNPP